MNRRNLFSVHWDLKYSHKRTLSDKVLLDKSFNFDDYPEYDM